MRPIAFRIRDFRSIVDSGVCPLSSDGITVLAGQNESGKTAILSALRDFDLEEGDAPSSSDYLPEGRLDAQPKVSVQFAVDPDQLVRDLAGDHLILPQAAVDAIRQTCRLWITRDLNSGRFCLDECLRMAWGSQPETSLKTTEEAESEGTDDDDDLDETEETASEPEEPKLLDSDEVGRLT